MKWLAIGGVAVLVLGVGVGLFVRSCSADKNAAERTVSELYGALEQDDYEAALALYHPENWSRLTRAQVLAELRAVDNDLGHREGGRLVGWHVQKGSDSWVDLTYENQYEKRATMEWFRLVRLDGEYRILVHNYDLGPTE